jgi:hypothetical protein
MAILDIEGLRKFGYRSLLPLGDAPSLPDSSPSSYGQPITDSVYGSQTCANIRCLKLPSKNSWLNKRNKESSSF